MNHTKTYPMPAEPEGETLRAKIEEALGLPVTALFEASPVGVMAEGDQLVVRITADEPPAKGTWKKIDDVFEAHKKQPHVKAKGQHERPAAVAHDHA